MRTTWAWMMCLVAAAWSAAAQAPEKCAIEGRVTNAATGAPLKRATVWTEAFSPARGVGGHPGVSGASTVTDAEGRFRLENLDAGSYFLSARRGGYLDQGYGAAEPEVVGPPLKLAAGERMRDAVIKLTPQALLYGKVTDEDGEAAPDAEVTVYRVSYAGGRKHLERFTAAMSRADGSVVIGNLGPGRYYLGAAIPGGVQDSDAREIYVPTYYPGAADAAQAAPVEVAAGAEVRGLDIRLRKARVFRIRGRSAPNATLQLTPRDEGFVEGVRYSANTASDGRFEFSGVLPGRYSIDADESTSFFAVAVGDGMPERVAAPLPVRPAAVEVTDSDLEDVVLPAADTVDITGAIVGGRRGMRTAISLVPLGRERAAGAQADAAGGAFRMRRVLPGVYEIGISGLDEGFYVKGVKFGGREIGNRELDLTSGGGSLEITLSADGGEISGTARDADGKPVPGALVQIWPLGGGGARALKADENGAFRFRGLAPVEYRALAWESLDDDLAGYAPFRARFEWQAKEVKVAERGKPTVELKAVPRQASAAEARKLR